MEEREESDAKFSRNQDKLGLAALREEKGTSRDETIGGGKICPYIYLCSTLLLSGEMLRRLQLT